MEGTGSWTPAPTRCLMITSAKWAQMVPISERGHWEGPMGAKGTGDDHHLKIITSVAETKSI